METDTTRTGSCLCNKEGTVFTDRKVRNAVTLALVMVSVFLLITTLHAVKTYRYSGAGNTVIISGEGEVFATPDTAEFTFSLIEEGATTKIVKDAVAGKADAILQILKEKGIEDKDVKTTMYSLQPKYEWVQDKCVTVYSCPGRSVQKGFTLTQSVQVKARDLDVAGEILGAISDAGATSVSDLAFTVYDDKALKDQAREGAIADARARAQKLAEALGVRLGRVVEFSEATDGYAPLPFLAGRDEASMKMEALPAVLPTGENRISSNVTIVYEIVQ